jgi:hypothetical protein
LVRWIARNNEGSKSSSTVSTSATVSFNLPINSAFGIADLRQTRFVDGASSHDPQGR